MVAVQKLKENEITEQDSLLLTRNLLRIAIFNISYIRGLFPEKYFNDKSVPALEMKIKKLMPMDAESRRLIDWMEKGVYDALQRKYLKTLLFCVCEAAEGPMIEEYTFSFSYSTSDSEEVSMNVNRSGNKKQGTMFKASTTDITPNQMRSSACKMVRTLVQLMRTLDRMPDERTILMKILYYDDVTPIDYEPPFFRSCCEQDGNNPWTRNPLKMEVGNVNSKHFVLALKVKSVLDPCEDENDDLQEDEEVSLGADSLQLRSDSSSSTDSEVHQLDQDQYIVAPAGNRGIKQIAGEESGRVHEDDTQDVQEEGEKLACVRDWIVSRHMDTIDVTDILSNFPDISVVLTEGKPSSREKKALSDLIKEKIRLISEIMEKLSNEGLLTKVGKDSYTINKPKKLDIDLGLVKEEIDIPEHRMDGKAQPGAEEDYMYMKALYHALPMDYVTVAKLQSKLEDKANQYTVRKLLDKMAQDGFIESKVNRRLGKRIIHSESTKKKLLEVKKALANKASGVESNGISNKSNGANVPASDLGVIPRGFPVQAKSKLKRVRGSFQSPDPRRSGSHGQTFCSSVKAVGASNLKDTSTCGGLHSIGSDLTRTRGKSGNSARSEQTSCAKTREQARTPVSMAEPAASRESTIPRIGDEGVNAKSTNHGEALNVRCSRSTQEKRSRKASAVEEPIVQYVKRQKPQPT